MVYHNSFLQYELYKLDQIIVPVTSFSLQAPTYTRPLNRQRIMSEDFNGKNAMDSESRLAFDEIPKYSLTPIIKNSKNIEKIDTNIIPGRVLITKITTKPDNISDICNIPSLEISEDSNDEDDDDDEEDEIIQQITKNKRKSSSIPPTLKIQRVQSLPHLLIVSIKY